MILTVGGGTAGSVMANRLSQKPCVSVLLLEAGGIAPTTNEIPGYSAQFRFSEIDWAYRSTPQKYSAFGQRENVGDILLHFPTVNMYNSKI